MGAPGPPGQKGPPGPPVSFTDWMFAIRPNSAAFPDTSLPTDLLHQSTVYTYTHFSFCSVLLSKMLPHCEGLDWTKES